MKFINKKIKLNFDKKMKKSAGQNNYLLNSKIKNSSVNNKQLFPNLHLVKNVRKKNEKNIYSKIKIFPKKKERFLSQTIINDYNDINNNKAKVGINENKMKLYISQSEKNINDNNDGDNKDYINSNFNNEAKITSKKFLKSYDISKNSENKNNLSSHNEIISDLLNKTEKFFEDLGVFLEERNKKYFNGFNKNDFKTKKVYGFATKRNNLIFNSNLYNKRKNTNNHNEKNLISLRKYTILNNPNQNKSISTINLHNDDNNKKSVSDAIIQTLNTLDDNNQNIKQEEDQEQQQQQNQEQIQNKRLKQEQKIYEFENRNERNNILPLLTKSLDIIEPNKRVVKIAEVKKVYPVYPFNRIIQLNPSLDKNNKYNFNIHRKFLLDMRDVFRHDDKYNYQQLMNNFKYKSVNKKTCCVYSYKLKSSFSYKKISREKIKLIK